MGKRNVMFLALFFLILFPSAIAQTTCSHIINNDKLEITSIIDNSQTNKANWSWKPSENIKINVSAINRNLTEDTFQLKLYFLNSGLEEKNITTDPKNITRTITLKKNESKNFYFSFQLAEPKKQIYYLYAQLLDKNNNSICTNLKASSKNTPTTINIEQKQKIIIVQNITGPINLTGGSTVNYTVTIVNFGSETEPQVLVVLYNKNLGIRKGIKILDLKPIQPKTVIFNLTIPINAAGEEQLLFSTEYNYKNETDFYYKSSDRAKIFLIRISANKIIKNKTTIKHQIIMTKNNTKNRTKNETVLPVKLEKHTPSYFWPIMITIFLIMMIIIAVYLIIKHNKKEYLKTYAEELAPANAYVKKIQEADY